jgi:tetratricopeptide (TPR) repeat protein
MRARRLVALVIVLAAQTAVAQPSTPDNRTRALQLFDESATLYKNGEFEKAAELLREAYGLYPEPLLLYNLARALESVGDLGGAVENYERYLAEATQIDDRAAIERRVVTLKEQLARTSAPVHDETPTPPVNEPPPNETKAGPLATGAAIDDAAPPPSLAPWFVVGGGVTIVAAGGVFAYLAGSAEDDAHTAPIQEDASRSLDDARRDAKLANLLFIAGGVAAAGGVTWAVIDRRRGGTRAAPTVAGARLQVAPAWVGLSWELR